MQLWKEEEQFFLIDDGQVKNKMVYLQIGRHLPIFQVTKETFLFFKQKITQKMSHVPCPTNR